uniref:Auxin response factor 18 n=1 Tax=Cajanus cajan TaxID=3821 RepID=A0A151TRU1_CAJCA|nr:Auxin response factor 18 [Cajanus cajan]
MITFMDTKEKSKEVERCLDPQLWHACAGGMVQMPAVNTKVYYFPQGHAEHACAPVNFRSCPKVPPFVPCRVAAIKYMADPETDEVYAKLRLVPLNATEADYDRDVVGAETQDKPASFAKTLTQSDANNGGGFSVPSTFVNHKKLVAGDSIVFLRAENGDLCVGIRRAKKGIGGGPEAPSGWNPAGGNCPVPYGGFSAFLREDDNRILRNGNSNGLNPSVSMIGRGKVRPEAVIEAANLAANKQPFEVVYYPRASTPEFCVKASLVEAALQIRWCSGIRFKMAFETEDSSRISWFMGTISSVQVADPLNWPNSPWRLLQVTWDEPDLLQNVRRVSPWLVELVSNMPAIHLSPFSPPRKKLRLPQHPDFPLDGQIPLPTFPGNLLGPSNTNQFGCLPESTPAGMQGARHAHYGISLSDLHLNKLQSGLFPAGFPPLDHAATPMRVSNNPTLPKPSMSENVSCLLSMANSTQSPKKLDDGKTPHLMLFGQKILTEQQISLSSSGDTLSPVLTRNCSSDGNADKVANFSDGSGSALHHQGQHERSSCERFQWYRDNHQESEANLETGHCKVFMESEDVGRTMDLSLLQSYDDLNRKLADMFSIEKSQMLSQVLYRDKTGAVKHIGDEPFSDFTRTARRLTILMDSGSNNVGV